MAIKAENHAKARGFDAVYINGQEDVDLCLRINLHSQNIVGMPQTRQYSTMKAALQIAHNLFNLID